MSMRLSPTNEYRQKAAIVQAWQWNPGNLAAAGEIVGFLMMGGVEFHHPSGTGETTTLAIGKDEMVIQPGEWIVRDSGGAIRRCKHDVFETTYEPA
jgi:hypothetical protein